MSDFSNIQVNEQPASAQGSAGEHPTPGIWRTDEGTYRWVYTLPMLGNPTLLLYVWRVLFLAFLIVWLFSALTGSIYDALCGYGWDWESFAGTGMIFLVLFPIFCFIALIAYLIIAAVNNGESVYIYEMSDKDVTLIVSPSQLRKEKKLRELLVTASLIRLDLLSVTLAKRTTHTSSFAFTRKLTAKRNRDAIFLRQLFGSNIIFARPEDYDFVLDHMLSRIPETAKTNVSVTGRNIDMAKRVSAGEARELNRSVLWLALRFVLFIALVTVVLGLALYILSLLFYFFVR